MTVRDSSGITDEQWPSKPNAADGDLVRATEVAGPDSEKEPRQLAGKLQTRHVDALDYDRYSIDGVGVDPSTVRPIEEGQG